LGIPIWDILPNYMRGKIEKKKTKFRK